MSVIDRQGRLFGRWNLIDVFAGVCVLALAPMGYFGLRVAAERRAQIAAAKRPPVIEQPRVTEDAEAALPQLSQPTAMAPQEAAPQELVDWEFLDVETTVTVDSAAASAGLMPGVAGVAESVAPPTMVQSVRELPGADQRPKKQRRGSFSLERIVHFRVACHRVDTALECPEGPLRIGAPFTFSADGFTVSGKIVALAWDGDARAIP